MSPSNPSVRLARRVTDRAFRRGQSRKRSVPCDPCCTHPEALTNLRPALGPGPAVLACRFHDTEHRAVVNRCSGRGRAFDFPKLVGGIGILETERAPSMCLRRRREFEQPFEVDGSLVGFDTGRRAQRIGARPGIMRLALTNAEILDRRLQETPEYSPSYHRSGGYSSPIEDRSLHRSRPSYTACRSITQGASGDV